MVQLQFENNAEPLNTKDPGSSRGRGLKGPFRWRWVPVWDYPPVTGHVENPLTRTPPPLNRVCLLSLDHLLPGRVHHRRVPTRPVPWAAQASLRPPRHSRQEAWTLDTTICWGTGEEMSTGIGAETAV